MVCSNIYNSFHMLLGGAFALNSSTDTPVLLFEEISRGIFLFCIHGALWAYKPPQLTTYVSCLWLWHTAVWKVKYIVYTCTQHLTVTWLQRFCTSREASAADFAVASLCFASCMYSIYSAAISNVFFPLQV
jgi:hypothetical protein